MLYIFVQSLLTLTNFLDFLCVCTRTGAFVQELMTNGQLFGLHFLQTNPTDCLRIHRKSGGLDVRNFVHSNYSIPII